MWFSYTYLGKWCDWYHHFTDFHNVCDGYECGIPKIITFKYDD